MNPVSEESLPFAHGATRLVFAKDQPQYTPLPVNKFSDGSLYSEWEPTDEERALLLKGAGVRVRLWQWTFNRALQPVAVELVAPPEASTSVETDEGWKPAQPEAAPFIVRMRAAWRVLIGRLDADVITAVGNAGRPKV